MEVTFAEWIEKEVEGEGGKKEKVKERVDTLFESHECELVSSLARRYLYKQAAGELSWKEAEKMNPQLLSFKTSKPIPGHLTIGAVQDEDQFVFTLSLS